MAILVVEFYVRDKKLNRLLPKSQVFQIIIWCIFKWNSGLAYKMWAKFYKLLKITYRNNENNIFLVKKSTHNFLSGHEVN